MIARPTDSGFSSLRTVIVADVNTTTLVLVGENNQKDFLMHLYEMIEGGQMTISSPNGTQVKWSAEKVEDA